MFIKPAQSLDNKAILEVKQLPNSPKYVYFSNNIHVLATLAAFLEVLNTCSNVYCSEKAVVRSIVVLCGMCVPCRKDL